MIIVDSSVWIDYFNGKDTSQTDKLDEILGVEPIGIGDIILTAECGEVEASSFYGEVSVTEVLQGFRADKDYRTAKKVLTSLTVFNMLDLEIAIKSADNFRTLRKQDITIRKTNDVIIATFCLENNHSLLFSDKDFIPFVNYLGLHTVIIDS